jgi:S-adenosylmethionine-diacylglycerol 3-amino-3-carboxypropyl transferase
VSTPPAPVAEARSEVAAEADFSLIRYAQCWEDTDVLLEALDIQPGDACFSVGSGGDNTLSMLSRDPGSVVAVDLSPAQNFVIELKRAAFRTLSHPQTLELAGISNSTQRPQLYQRVRAALPADARMFWDARTAVIEQGLSSAGKFERYFALFRRFVLPLVHSRSTVEALFVPRSLAERRRFYDAHWNNRRWRALFLLFFSRFVMGRLGRDPRFFRYVEGKVATRILARAEHALVELDPARNPYLHWIAYGRFVSLLPHVWRPENFDAIRRNLDRLELRVESVESWLHSAAEHSIDRFNLSDIFEYISEDASDAVFDDIARCARPGARIAYWNMMAARRCPERLSHRLHTLEADSRRLHRQALSFFYGAFQVDQAGGPQS